MEDTKVSFVIRAKLDYIPISLVCTIGVILLWFVENLVSVLLKTNDNSNKLVILLLITLSLFGFSVFSIGLLGRRLREIKADLDNMVLKTYIFKHKYSYDEIMNISEEGNYIAIKSPIYWLPVRKYCEIIVNLHDEKRESKVKFNSERFNREDVSKLLEFIKTKLKNNES